MLSSVFFSYKTTLLQIVFLGSKDGCEKKTAIVSRKGKILDENAEMEIIEGSSADQSDNIKLDGALTRFNEMRSEMVTKGHEAESRDAQKKIIDLLTKILATNKTILKRQTSFERSADELQYSYFSRARLEALRKYRCDNIAHLPWIWKKRSTKINLCTFKYFHVAEQAQALGEV
ncbi:hypothetical protein ANCCAN_05735 [Ancylostoma caninum]|uniref:Uncharacterized protein n=1 Tax=Ancylostoma caninum TaxID=29170 RepID=A0A368GYX1_ANCCA|nr:hypothetical protein ANCCAN_05735 [Ancylostoma caninum]